MSDDLTRKRELEQHLVSIYRKVWQKEWFEKTFYETMKIRKELSLNQTLKKVVLNRETFNALEKAYLSRLRFDARDGEADATLYGIPVDVDDSIAPGNIGFVIEIKAGEQP